MSLTRKRRTRPACVGLVLVCLLVSGLPGRRAAAQVSLRVDSREGHEVHILASGGREWLVDPADGGSVTLVGEHESADVPCVLLQDRRAGRIIPYGVERTTGTDSTALVTLSWRGGGGLAVEKSVCVLRGVQTVQVSYTIANGSDASLAVSLVSSGGRDWVAAARDREGLQRLPGDGQGGGVARGYVAWYALSDPEGRGAAVSMGAGLARSAAGTTGDSGLSVACETSLIPPGRVLGGEAWIAPLRGLGLPTGVSPLLLGRATVAQAGETVRFRAGVLPLGRVGPGRALLAVKRSEGAGEWTLEGPPGELASGVPVDLTFYWGPPEPGEYEVELRVPGLGEPLVLGRCTVTGGRAVLGVPPIPHVEKVKLGRVANWVGGVPPPAGGEAPAPALFMGPGGELTRIVVDVGVGEAETVLLAPLPPLTAMDAPVLDIGDLAARRAERRLPRSAVQLLEAAGSFTAQPFGGGGLVRAAPGPPWHMPGPFALRISVPYLPADTYSSDLVVPELGTQAKLPVEVRVWPVERTSPGPIRLFVVPEAPRDSGDWEPWTEGSAYGVSAFALPAPFADATAWRTMSADGTDTPLATWPTGGGGAGFPPMRFSGAHLGALLMSGTSDVLVKASSAAGGLAEGVGTELARHLWRQLAVQVAGSGFSRPLVIEPVPIRPDAVTEEWLARAEALRAAGWSVCGPLAGGLPSDGLLARLSQVTDVLVFEGVTAGDLARARDRLGPAARVGVWVRMPSPDASYADGVNLMTSIPWRQADIVVLGGQGGRYAGTGPAQPPPSLVWEGIRDGLDDVCYLRRLADAGGGVGDAGPGSLPQKRAVLERLALALARVRAAGITLAWRGHRLVVHGRPSAVIAIDPAFPEQASAARMLNQIVQSRTGASLPVVDVAMVATAPHVALAITFGSPSTNAMVARLAGRNEDELKWHLGTDECWIGEYRRSGTSWLALMTADPAGWGTAVARFAALLQDEASPAPGE